MTIDLLLHPFRPIRKRHLSLMRQVATIQHGLLDQSTSLGFLWSFLHPLVMLGVLYAFFRQRVGEGVPNYAVYLLIGLVQFTHFSKSTSAGMRVLHRMRNLATNVIFPKDVLVYSALLADLPEFVISLAATVIIAVATGVTPSWAFLMRGGVPADADRLDGAAVVGDVRRRPNSTTSSVGMRLSSSSRRSSTTSTCCRRGYARSPPARWHLIGFARPSCRGALPTRAAGRNFAINGPGYVAIILFRRAEPALVERL